MFPSRRYLGSRVERVGFWAVGFRIRVDSFNFLEFGTLRFMVRTTCVRDPTQATLDPIRKSPDRIRAPPIRPPI